MIAEVLEFITGLKDSRPITETVGEATYAVKSDRTLGEVIRPPAPIAKPTLALATLNGFVDAIAAKVDEFPADAVAIHVESYSSVALVSLKAGEFGCAPSMKRSTPSALRGTTRAPRICLSRCRAASCLRTI
jgi:hypothetical protein